MPKMYDPTTMTVTDTDDTPAEREPRCNRCGSTDVRWRQQTGKWVLFSNEPGKLHVCDLDDSDFGAVPE